MLNNWKLLILLCLTLGLAPFSPEPHLWGKLKWLWGGAVDMKAMDVFDLALHSLPFLLLIRYLIIKSLKRESK
ncbi:hypothetical protein POV27_11230 [Aureisphaera galaxeae]|nr:hypothetical protein [Aureisphaera galaxeae]MDC8004623.1 hypothetical protein [Aureisphaera galaxeae]